MSQQASFEELLFIEKTINHIRLVQDNMRKIAIHGGIFEVNPVDIIQRSLVHDYTKFDSDVFSGYVLYNYRNHLRETGAEIPEYDKETDDFIFECVKKHRSNSSHHPEYYSDINQMSTLDIIEMVCDWVAVSQEFVLGQYRKSREFAEYSFENLYPFNNEKQQQIYEVIDLLTQLNGREW